MQPLLGGSSYLREAALAQMQAEVPSDLPLVPLFSEPRVLPLHPAVPFPDTNTNKFHFFPFSGNVVQFLQWVMTLETGKSAETQ